MPWYFSVYKFDLFLLIIQEKLKKSQLERDLAVKGEKQDQGKTAGGRRQGD